MFYCSTVGKLQLSSGLHQQYAFISSILALPEWIHRSIRVRKCTRCVESKRLFATSHEPFMDGCTFEHHSFFPQADGLLWRCAPADDARWPGCALGLWFEPTETEVVLIWAVMWLSCQWAKLRSKRGLVDVDTTSLSNHIHCSCSSGLTGSNQHRTNTTTTSKKNRKRMDKNEGTERSRQ